MTIHKITAALGVLFLAWSTGCQTTPHRPATAHATQPHAPQTAVQQAAAVRPPTAVAGDFDRKREEAEYASALARWEEGDSPGCRAMLSGLLKRRPEHREANLLFAELCLLEDAPADGLPCAERVCRRDPNDAQAQHTRGLLLEALGKRDDAVKAYELAVKYAPRDEIYVASLEAANSRPARESLFIAGGRTADRADDELTLSSPRTTRENVHLTALRGDDGAATITDEE